MKNQFASRLKDFIQELGISKRKFAKRVGVSATSVSDWVSGKIQPNAESIYLICKEFNVSADYLLGITPY